MDYYVLGILESRSFGASLRFETQAVSPSFSAPKRLYVVTEFTFLQIYLQN